jgi:hypothetical protein
VYSYQSTIATFRHRRNLTPWSSDRRRTGVTETHGGK